MSKTAFTIKAFGIYLLVLGVTLLLVPNLLLSVFGIPETTEVWIRVLGVVVVSIGVYYWSAALSEAVPMFKASIYTRTFVFITFIVFVLLDYTSPMLILFGAIDVAGGGWTYLTLKNEKQGV